MSPVPVHSDYYLFEMGSASPGRVDLEGLMFGEAGLYIIAGELRMEGIFLEKDNCWLLRMHLSAVLS